MTDVAAQPDVTDDAFLGGALNILQPRAGYRAGLDAVMLAASVGAGAVSPLQVLDLGAGVGTAGLCVARRIADARVVLLERERQLAGLAAENAQRNGLAARVRVANTIIPCSPAELRACDLDEEGFDHVIANPPYHDRGSGTLASHGLKAGAHAMDEGDLEVWVRFMARMSAPGGAATIIHKSDALLRVLAAMAPRFGALKVLLLYPRASEVAHRVLVQGTKGSRGPMQILPGFVLHGEGNAFTPDAQAILRNGAALSMRAQT